MVELLIFIIASIGMAHILVDGSIFNSFKEWLGKPSVDLTKEEIKKYRNPFRRYALKVREYIKRSYPKTWEFVFIWPSKKLLALMSCYQCSGFWSGGIIGLFMWLNHIDPLHANNDWQAVLIIFAYACAGAYVSMTAAVISVWMQSNSGDQ